MCVPESQGIPLATCTALMLASRYGQQAPFVYDRKEEKDHGEGGLLVGASELLQGPPEGVGGAPRVLVVDDVLTSGTALRAGVGKIRSLAPEAQLVALVVLLDREEKKQGQAAAAVLRCTDTAACSRETVPCCGFGVYVHRSSLLRVGCRDGGGRRRSRC